MEMISIFLRHTAMDFIPISITKSLITCHHDTFKIIYPFRELIRANNVAKNYLALRGNLGFWSFGHSYLKYPILQNIFQGVLSLFNLAFCLSSTISVSYQVEYLRLATKKESIRAFFSLSCP